MINFRDRTDITSPGLSGAKNAPVGDRLLIDWVSFTSSIHDVVSLKQLLGLELAPWEDDYGRHGFQYQIKYGSIHIYYNDKYYTGKTAGYVFLEMSGQGCRTFESDGNGDYDVLFQLCLRDIDLPKPQRRCRLTRLDLAFDDTSGHLDIFTIYDAVRAENFTSRMKDSHFHGGRDRGVKGYSVDFGSKSSNVFIRIYDKAAERGFSPEDVPHWVRCELQLKQENAMGFLYQVTDNSMSEMYKAVLKNYLQFREPSDTDSNKRRWAVSEWWDKFLDDVVPRTVWQRPGSEYNLSKLETQLFVRNAGALKTYIRLEGEKMLLNRIRQAPDSLNLNYKRLIAQREYEKKQYHDFLKKLESRDANKEAAERRAAMHSGVQLDIKNI